MSVAPKISVLLPVYNGEKYLPETIESVLNQTFSDFEFLIVNEFGSSDKATAIIHGYEQKDKRIRVIQNTERLGLSLSLNRGIDEAKGKYIARVDGDDPSYPERFEKQIAYLEAHAEVFLAGTLQRTLLKNGVSYDEYPTLAEELKATLLFGCDISHCSVMMRRDWLNKNNWRYTDEFMCEDFDLWSKIKYEVPMVNLPEILCDHRWGFGQKSNVVSADGKIDNTPLIEEGRKVSARELKKLGVNIEAYNPAYVLGGFRMMPWQAAKGNADAVVAENFALFCEIEDANSRAKLHDPAALHNVLCRRWVKWLLPCVGGAGENYHDKRFTDYQDISRNYIKSVPKFASSVTPAAAQKMTAEFAAPIVDDTPAPLVSVVMTVYNGAKHISEAIESIINQTYTDWEFLIINEFGSNDGTVRIVQEYVNRDNRIKLIQNTSKLGFAESLNRGIKMARGKYIARMDADDLSLSNRLEVESKFLDANPEIGHVGSWQKHFGRNNWIHKPLATHDEIKAALLFRCDVCHSTVMFRRDVFVDNNLFYDPNILAEDFELWTRAICVTRFATIPQILGKYRTGDNSQTDQKFAVLIPESGMISAKAIERIMGIVIDKSDYDVLEGWKPQIVECEKQGRFKKILLRIWEANQQNKQIDDSVLLSQLYAFWRWAAYGESWKDRYKVDSIDTLINDNGTGSASKQRTEQRSLKSVAKVVIKKILRPFLGYVDRRFDWIMSKIDETRNTLYWDLDQKIYYTERQVINNTNWNRGWITDRTDEIKRLITTLNYNVPYVPYSFGEKVRLVFLFEMPSMYPSWDTVLEHLKTTKNTDIKVVLYDQIHAEPVQIAGAEAMLKELAIDYVRFDEFDMDEYNPHIVVYQTPYDEYHHPPYLSAPILRGKGYRIVYITYGIEITKTAQSEIDQFERQVVQNGWRVYTFSPVMRKDYLRHISPKVCKALGHPKFDRLFDKTIIRNSELIEEAGNKKIVLLKLHWPKTGNGKTYSPSLDVYTDFLSYLPAFDDLFFAVMPHPNFFYNVEKHHPAMIGLTEQIRNMAENTPNAMLCTDADYRPTLICADYVITDRSAVMVEAGVLDVPVLYMTGKDWEPLNDAVAPVVLSYYQGQSCEDILRFIEMCRKGHDPKRTERRAAVAEYIPLFDGKSGERIAEDMIKGVMEGK